MKEGWKYKKLKEVGFTQTGTTPSKSVKSFYGGEIPFIRPAELNIDGSGSIEYNSELKLTSEGAMKSRTIKANSTLMCCIGSVGKTGYTIKDVTCNQQINTITPYDGYNGKFIYYALLTPSFQNEVIKIANSAKATLAIISKGKWEEMYIPVPPLSEQQSIVDYLDFIFENIDVLKANAEKSLVEAKAFFQAALEEMLEPKDGWEEKKLGEICSQITDGTHHSPPNGESGNYKYITAKNIRIWGLDLSNVTYVSEDIHKEITARCNPQKGDVLYIKDGATTGIAIVNPLEEEFSMLSSVALIKPYKDVLSSEFLCYTLNSPSIYNQTRSQMDGAAITRVTLVKIKGFVISIPPLSEQQSIVETLDSLKSKVDQLQANYEKISKECDALKQAILRQVFE